MGIMFKLNNYYKKIKSYFSNIENKLEDRIIDVVNLTKNIELEFKTEIDNILEKIISVEDDFKKDNSSRKMQVAKLSKKIDEHKKLLHQNFGEVNANFKYINDKLKKLDETKPKINQLDNLLIMMRHEMAQINSLRDKFDFINTIQEKVKEDFDNYLHELRSYHRTHIEMLHKDISAYKKNDNAVVRLSSLETRITLLEEKHKEMLKKNPNKKFLKMEYVPAN